MTDDDYNSALRPWVSVGEAATQAMGKVSCELPKQEREIEFLARMTITAEPATASGQTMIDTDDLRRLVEIAERYQAMDREAAKYVESVIVIHSRHFTGDEPYVGWEGLGMALREDYELLAAFEQVEEEDIKAILERTEKDR